MKTIPEEDGGVAQGLHKEPRTSSEPPRQTRTSSSEVPSRNNGVNGFHKLKPLPGEPSSKKGLAKKKAAS